MVIAFPRGVEVQVVLLIVPGLVLVGEVAIKRGLLVVLDLGLDVFCHVADSYTHPRSCS